ncbi:MAG: helix-turn-helix domain-containing protein [Bacteroidetes bacterium]|nr:helix-turn-helix domain-containing protein [Bacteroidota bacterium]
MRFEDFIKEKRQAAELTLRKFCALASVDPSNWSKIERGLGEAPRSNEMLDRIADILKLSPSDKDTLRDLAIVAAFPKEFRDDKVIEKLPIFFRTVRGEKPTEAELEKLFEVIKNS